MTKLNGFPKMYKPKHKSKEHSTAFYVAGIIVLGAVIIDQWVDIIHSIVVLFK